MKNYLRLAFVFFISIVFVQQRILIAQNVVVDTIDCLEKNAQILESQLLILFGEQWVKENTSKQNKIYIALTLDSLGKIMTIDKYKADMMTQDQFERFVLGLKQKRFCLFNGDSHLSFEEFIKYGKNHYQYIFVYPTTIDGRVP